MQRRLGGLPIAEKRGGRRNPPAVDGKVGTGGGDQPDRKQMGYVPTDATPAGGAADSRGTRRTGGTR